MDPDKMFEVLLKGLEENYLFDEMRTLVNSILPVKKYQLLKRFLSNKERLSPEIRLNCLHIFLDERTKFLGFERKIFYQKITKSILKIIPKYCPNIVTIDFRNVWILNESKENFKIFLKQTTSLKTLRVIITGSRNCALYRLLLEEDFHQHDKDLQSGLLKIDYINGLGLHASECVQLLNLLPNLKSFGMALPLGPVLSSYIDDEDIVKKFNRITEFADSGKSSNTLQQLIKFCPKVNKIRLNNPQPTVIENLVNFPLLTELQIRFENPYFVEFINLLNKIGKQIKILILHVSPGLALDRNILHHMCPQLVKLEINPPFYLF